MFKPILAHNLSFLQFWYHSASQCVSERLVSLSVLENVSLSVHEKVLTSHAGPPGAQTRW